MKKNERTIEFIHGFSPLHGSINQWYIPFKENERTAECRTCSQKSLSDQRLPFFKTLPDKDHDEYYCGCWGFE